LLNTISRSSVKTITTSRPRDAISSARLCMIRASYLVSMKSLGRNVS
jgi:hypothetical protein